jgi:hypothetical protein
MLQMCIFVFSSPQNVGIEPLQTNVANSKKSEVDVERIVWIDLNIAFHGWNM